MTPCEITAAVTAVANFISCNFTDEQIDLLGAIFVQLGDTLAIISAQNALCQSVLSKNNNKATPN